MLAIADEVEDRLYGDLLAQLAPDLIVACGDLPFEYLENLVTRAGCPLVYVPGNHDPDLHPDAMPVGWGPVRARPNLGPEGCDNTDGRIVDTAGVAVAGLGGSMRYKDGPNQYTERQMSLRALRLQMLHQRRRLLRRRDVDVLLAHAAPSGLGDRPDPCHRGFEALNRLARRLRPRLIVHGHVHPYGRHEPDRGIGPTLVVNAIPYRLLEVPR